MAELSQRRLCVMHRVSVRVTANRMHNPMYSASNCAGCVCDSLRIIDTDATVWSAKHSSLKLLSRQRVFIWPRQKAPLCILACWPINNWRLFIIQSSVILTFYWPKWTGQTVCQTSALIHKIEFVSNTFQIMLKCMLFV